VAYSVRRLLPDDAAAYRAIRLEGLAAAPSAFGASLAEDTALGEDEWRARLGRNFAYGVFGSGELGGIAGFYVEGGDKTKHRGHLVGVYTRPAFRGTGASQQLLAEVIAAARAHVQYLYLQVTQTNLPAVRLYERMGFEIYGKDPGGLMVDGVMHEDFLMMLRLSPKATESESND
jgi:ribosomal protein S18 acetylase RimI-like enzyme